MNSDDAGVRGIGIALMTLGSAAVLILPPLFSTMFMNMTKKAKAPAKLSLLPPMVYPASIDGMTKSPLVIQPLNIQVSW